MRPLRRQPPRTRIERVAARRAQSLRDGLGQDVRRAREDSGISLSRLAEAAGVSKSQVHAVEAGQSEPRLETAARIGEALGMDLSVRLYPGTGPLMRDHIQAAMIEALLDLLDERWRAAPEVWVHRPARGVIDLVLEAGAEPLEAGVEPVVGQAEAGRAGAEPVLARAEPLIACEAQSELRRLEQQLRWSHAKADALGQARGRSVSRLLLLRTTRRTRAIVGEFAATIQADFPAHTTEAFAALTRRRPWPGPAIVWCDVSRSGTRVLPNPPRGVVVGR